MKTHPLIKNFPPLPSLDLILAVADGRNPNRPPQPQPAMGGVGSQGGSPPVYVPNPTGPPTPPSPRYWRCINGQVVQMTKADCEKGDGQCYASEQEARAHCKGKSCWCCINGQVVKTTAAACRERGGQCYGSRKEALRNCKPNTPPPPPPPPTRILTTIRPPATPTATPKIPGRTTPRPARTPSGKKPTPTPTPPIPR